MTPTIKVRDPFSPRALGSRPSFASYWPDTRFIELRSDDGYFKRLLGRAPTDEDEPLLMLGGSIVHHERVHWQIAHGLTWGMMRSALVSLRTTLASLFFRNLDPDALREELARHRSGTPPIARTQAFDLVVPDHWSATSHSIAEHAWLLTMLPEIVDYGGLVPQRPPDFILGIAAQHLASGFDPYAVLFGEEDAVFQNRVRSFRQEESAAALAQVEQCGISAMAVEECLAVSAQLTFLDHIETGSIEEANVRDQFRRDIVDGVFGRGGALYAPCFRAAERAAGCSFEKLDLRMMGILCELALDPPLPFEPDGHAAAWSWEHLHPGSRFTRLLEAAAKADFLVDKGAQLASSGQTEIETDLVRMSGLSRAEHGSVAEWLATYDEDTTEWPSQNLGWQHAKTALQGRSELAMQPGVLQDMFGAEDLPADHPFYDLPFVLLDGLTQTGDLEVELEARQAGQQVLDAHVARMTDHLAFRIGPLHPLGLPTNPEDGFTIFAERAHEFFEAAWGVNVPSIVIGGRP